MKQLLYIALIVIALYYMRFTPVVDIVHGFRDTWNYAADYVLTFRYRQPYLFIALPFIAVWLLGRK